MHHISKPRPSFKFSSLPLPATNWFITIFCIALESGCAAPAAPLLSQGDVPESDLCGYKIVYADEFNDLSVSAWEANGSRWIAHTPHNQDFGDAKFVDPEPGFPFEVDNGILRIEARKDSAGKWRSGILSSIDQYGNGFALKYGYFEMRAKLPPGAGVWPAFWLGTNQSKNSLDPSIEFDVFEYYGRAPGMFQSVLHVWFKDSDKTRSEIHITDVDTGTLSRDFHTFGVDVDPAWAIVYFDRREVWRVRTPVEHKKPLGLLIDLALGSGWPIDMTPNPSFMYVDYVRAYERQNNSENTNCISRLHK